MKLGNTSLLKVSIFLIGAVIFTLCIFWLPSLANQAAEMNPEFAYLRFHVLIGLYLTGIPFFLALYQALKLLNYIESGNAFSEFAVLSLHKIKNSANAIIILYLIGVSMLLIEGALHPGIAIIALVILFVSIMISVFASVLKELLKNALQIKTENDLTV